MTYEITRNYGPEAQTRVLNDYHLESVSREIDRAKEDLVIINQYLLMVEPHKTVVQNTAFMNEVSIDKEKNYSSGHINYRVNVYRYPIIQGGDKHKVFDYYGDAKIFPKGDGPTKKEAYRYARELATKHTCKIVGNVSEQVNAMKKEVLEI